MTGWQWFWILIGFLAYLIVLLFLYFYPPFEILFTSVLNGISFSNAIFWVALVIGVIGFCLYHWHAYRVHIVQQRSVESMVLSSLQGSTFIAVLLSGGAALQSVQILCVYLLGDGYSLGAEFGSRVVAVFSLVILTAVFGVIFWLLQTMRSYRRPA